MSSVTTETFILSSLISISTMIGPRFTEIQFNFFLSPILLLFLLSLLLLLLLLLLRMANEQFMVLK